MENELRWSTQLSPMLAVERPLPGLYVATGSRGLPSWFLSALCPALKHGARLLWIDAGNHFNAYGMSYASRAMGWDPKSVLSRVQLARPFNPFQLAAMVRHKVPAIWKQEPIVISDPFPMFYDEEISLVEARKVFSGVLDGIQALPAVWMVLAVNRQAPEERAGWFGELLRQARGAADLAADEAHWHLEKRIA